MTTETADTSVIEPQVFDAAVRSDEEDVPEPLDSIAIRRLWSLLACLTPSEEYVISRRYGLSGEGETTLDDLAQEFALTRERISQLEARAIRKLQKRFSLVWRYPTVAVSRRPPGRQRKKSIPTPPASTSACEPVAERPLPRNVELRRVLMVRPDGTAHWCLVPFLPGAPAACAETVLVTEWSVEGIRNALLARGAR